MPNPSTDWTPEERLKVVTKVAEEMTSIDMSSVSQDKVNAWADRLFVLATMKSTFLETNLERILGHDS